MAHPPQYSPANGLQSTSTANSTLTDNGQPLASTSTGTGAGIPQPSGAGAFINGRMNPMPFPPTYSPHPLPPPTPPQQPPSSLPTAAPLPRPITSAAPSTPHPAEDGPPFAVSMHPFFTHASAVAPGQPFPSIAPADQVRVKSWMQTDLAYEKSLTGTRRAQKVEMTELGEQLIRKQDWLGGELDRPRIKVRMEPDRLREKQRGKRGLYRKEVPLPKKQLRAVAVEPEILVPIRLEYEYEAYKLRDTFTWNLRETIVTPEIFASHLCEDLRLPSQPFYREIVTQIKRQIEDARLIEHFDSYLVDDLRSIREDNQRWFQNQAKKRKLQAVGGPGDDDMRMEEDGEEEEKPLSVGDLARNDVDSEGLRVLIKLDITLESIQLVDQFEWDFSDPRNSPEDFADTFAADLGLAGEFRTAIAHSIREQIDVFVKSLCLLGHVEGLPIPDDDLRREFLPSTFETIRSSTADFTPSLSQLTPDEIERNDKEREREVRRKRRQTKGRGVTLPDRDPVKTHRTLVPKPSNVPLHSFQDARGETVYPLPEMSHPYPIVAPVVPDKPAYLETVPAKGNLPANFDLLRAGGNRLKRLRQENGTPEAGSTLDASPNSQIEARSKTPTKTRKRLEDLGLHEHMINGAWFCANCGVPESCSVGRRKGPSGANSLCGSCGKFFHRYRRNRPCVYTTDLETHTKLRAEEKAKAAPTTSNPGTHSGSRPPGSTAAPSRESSEEPETPTGADSDSSLGPSRPTTADTARGRRPHSPDLPFVQIGSPDSEMSSLSSAESPAPGDHSRTLRDRESPAPRAPSQAHVRAEPRPPPPPPPPTLEPLPWMLIAAADLRARQKDDRFEIIPRPRPPDPSIQEWRVRCLDCPGKSNSFGNGTSWDNDARPGFSSSERHSNQNQTRGIYHYAPYPPRPQLHSNSSYSSNEGTAYSGGSNADSSRTIKQKRKKTTAAQLKVLTGMFEKTDSPDFADRESIKEEVNMTNREVQVWFQNRRAKVNRGKTEVVGRVRSPSSETGGGRASHSASPPDPATLPKNALGVFSVYQMPNPNDAINNWKAATHTNSVHLRPLKYEPPSAPLPSPHSNYMTECHPGYMNHYTTDLPTPPSPSSTLPLYANARMHPSFQSGVDSPRPFVPRMDPLSLQSLERRRLHSSDALFTPGSTYSTLPNGAATLPMSRSLGEYSSNGALPASPPLNKIPLDNYHRFLALPTPFSPELAYSRALLPMIALPSTPNNSSVPQFGQGSIQGGVQSIQPNGLWSGGHRFDDGIRDFYRPSSSSSAAGPAFSKIGQMAVEGGTPIKFSPTTSSLDDEQHDTGDDPTQAESDHYEDNLRDVVQGTPRSIALPESSPFSTRSSDAPKYHPMPRSETRGLLHLLDDIPT